MLTIAGGILIAASIITVFGLGAFLAWVGNDQVPGAIGWIIVAIAIAAASWIIFFHSGVCSLTWPISCNWRAVSSP
jgi:membrane-bound metal-dependent hydrolase YbcI (DUF457 family)